MELSDLYISMSQLVDEMKEFLDTHEDSNGTISEQDAQAYKKMEKRLTAIQNMIARRENLEIADKATRASAGTPIKSIIPREILAKPGEWNFSDNQDAKKSRFTSKAYHRSFFEAVRQNFKVGNEYLREGALTDGGYLCPVEFDDQIVSALEKNNVFRQIARVITTASSHQIPLVTSKPAAAWVGEGDNISLSKEQFGQATLGAHKLAVAVKTSNELLTDSYVDIESFLAQEFSDALARSEEESFLNGTGTDNQPLGLLPAMELSATSFIQTNGASLTPDDLINLEFSIDRPYRRKACWLTSEANLALIRKFKTTDQNYLWQQSLTAEEPNFLLGYPIYTTPYFPPAVSGNPVILFGDFSRFVIGDRAERTFRPLRELLALSDQTAFLMIERVDCVLTDRHAIRGLKIR